MASLLMLRAVPASAAGWTPVGTMPGLNDGKIWSLAVSPVSPSTIVAGTDNGIYLSTDAGAKWTLVGAKKERVWVVGFDPRTPADVYAGTQSHGIERSTDDGGSWTAITAGLPSTNVRSMTFSLTEIAAGTANGVALSTDGLSWHAGGLQGISIDALAVVANSPSLVLIAGTDSGNTDNGYLFENKGATWSALTTGGLPQGNPASGTLPATSVVALALASGALTANQTRRPLVVDTNLSAGAYRSLDSGQTWTGASGLPQIGEQTITLTTVTIDPLDPVVVYSGGDAAGSNGGTMMRSTDGGLTYSTITQGLKPTVQNVVSIAVAQTTPPTLYIAIDPENGPAFVDTEVDTAAPTPPTLVGEAPGAPIPTTLGTPMATASARASSPATRSASSGISGISLFHWPMPLVLELIIALGLIYAFIRWRQHRYVEGPP